MGRGCSKICLMVAVVYVKEPPFRLVLHDALKFGSDKLKQTRQEYNKAG